jgi:predicted DCC family thiol-disulfide oxidoreductase YuxK
MSQVPLKPKGDRPILLFDDECGVCRRIAQWVRKSAGGTVGEAGITVRGIGNDPEALRSLDPTLDIWDAYATIHVLMPDGSKKLGGEAVAEVLRRLPNTRWFAGSFGLSLLGFRPFQAILNLSYAILADVRPLFGCESCGTPSRWVRPIHGVTKWVKAMFAQELHPIPTPHFTRLAAAGLQPAAPRKTVPQERHP